MAWSKTRLVPVVFTNLAALPGCEQTQMLQHPHPSRFLDHDLHRGRPRSSGNSTQFRGHTRHKTTPFSVPKTTVKPFLTSANITHKTQNYAHLCKSGAITHQIPSPKRTTARRSLSPERTTARRRVGPLDAVHAGRSSTRTRVPSCPTFCTSR